MWKLKIPQKLKSYLWIVFYGKLLTNSLRMKRGLTNVSSCFSCLEMEDMNHIFRVCPKAVVIWSSLFKREWYSDTWDTPLLEWIKINLKKGSLLMNISPRVPCLLFLFGRFGKTATPNGLKTEIFLHKRA